MIVNKKVKNKKSEGKYLLLALCFFVIGCIKLGENYQAPEINPGDNWDTAGMGRPANIYVDDAGVEYNWWLNFKDAQITDLVQKTLKFNHDIKTAEIRIKEAMAQHNVAFAALLPEVNAMGGLKREGLGAISGEKIDNSSSVGLRGSWNLDVFGKNKRENEAAKAIVESTAARLESVKLAIISETIKTYIKLRQAQKQKNLVTKNIEIQQETLDGIKEKRKVGEATELEVVRASAQVEDTRIRLSQIDTDIAIALNRLYVLSGESPENLAMLLQDDDAIPLIQNEIVVSTPMQVIQMNPDIRVAERELAQKTALTGAAFASMFPRLSLDAFFGTSESSLFGAATPWNIAGNLAAPIINFGRLKSQVEIADSRKEQAFENYQQTVLLALEKVKNAFVAYKNEKARVSQLKSVLAKREREVEISKEQYNSGVITQLDLLLAQQNRLDAENNLAISEANVAGYAVAIYEALGVS